MVFTSGHRKSLESSLTLATHTSVLSVPAVVNVEPIARAICHVHLQTPTPHIVQDNGPGTLAKVSETESKGSRGWIAQLSAHNLRRTQGGSGQFEERVNDCDSCQ